MKRILLAETQSISLPLSCACNRMPNTELGHQEQKRSVKEYELDLHNYILKSLDKPLPEWAKDEI